MCTVHIVFQSSCVFVNVFAVEDIMPLMPLLEMTWRPGPAADNKSTFMSWQIRTQPRNKNRQKQMKKQRIKSQFTKDGGRQMQCRHSHQWRVYITEVHLFWSGTSSFRVDMFRFVLLAPNAMFCSGCGAACSPFVHTHVSSNVVVVRTACTLIKGWTFCKCFLLSFP